jgi:hypothetical protein
MDHGSRHHHTAVMGPHPRQQSTQQSTNIICDGFTSLKLEKIFITSNMTINARRVSVNEQRQQCSNAMMGAVQPTGRYCRLRQHVVAPNDIFNEGWRGGRGGGGCGEVICPRPRVSMGTLGFCGWHDSQWLPHNNSNKKYDTHMMLIWY